MFNPLRRRSFVSININNIIGGNDRKIFLEQTLIQRFFHFIYYLFNLSYSKSYLYYFKNDKHSKLFDLVVYDNGIRILDTFVKYEYIISITNHPKFYTLNILGKLENNTILLGNNILKLSICIPEPKNFVNTFKSNMNYHLNYHQISPLAMDYYNSQNVRKSLKNHSC